MGDVYKTAASLRFHGDDLDPNDLSRVFGTEPTVGVKKGEIWVSPKGLEVVSPFGRWHLHTDDVKPGDIDQQIASLFSGLSDDMVRWREYAERYHGNIFAGIFLSQFNEGMSISPATLNAVGMRGLELGLDIYTNDGRDEVIGLGDL
jgi:Domain of unknown function (DUF4279)